MAEIGKAKHVGGSHEGMGHDDRMCTVAASRRLGYFVDPARQLRRPLLPQRRELAVVLPVSRHLYETAFLCLGDSLGAPLHSELSVRALEERLDRLPRDAELLRDFPVREAARDECERLGLSRR